MVPFKQKGRSFTIKQVASAHFLLLMDYTSLSPRSVSGKTNSRLEPGKRLPREKVSVLSEVFTLLSMGITLSLCVAASHRVPWASGFSAIHCLGEET